MLISGTDQEHLVPLSTQRSGMHIGRQHRPDKVAEMFHTVDIRQCACDEVACQESSKGPEGDGIGAYLTVRVDFTQTCRIMPKFRQLDRAMLAR